MRRSSRIGWISALSATFLVSTIGAPRAGIEVIQREGISYVSGGVGEKEQQELKAREKEFNLKLVFTLVEGNYLADVNVVLTGAKGRKIVERVADGPFFMARLPAGQYTVAATYRGKTVTRTVAVSEKRLHTEYLRWPADPKTDLPVSRWINQ